ncbi:MAG: hypothetical protein WCY59_08075 [Anaerovoracaceae bacterium]
MAVKLSKALAGALAAGAAVINESYGPGDEIVSFGDGTGTGSTDEIVAAAGTPFVGFHVGDMVTVMTESGTNDGTYEILDITDAGTQIEVAAGSFTTENAATAGMATIATARGHSVRDLFKYAVLDIYSAPRPTDPEDAETGTLLCTITESSGAFVADADANGLLFDEVVDGVLAKDAAQTWSGTIAETGTGVWARLYSNAYDTGEDVGEAFIRLDMDIGDDLDTPTSFTSGQTRTIDEFYIHVPLAPAV